METNPNYMFYQFHGAELKLQFIVTGIKNSKTQFYLSAFTYTCKEHGGYQKISVKEFI